MKILTKYLRPFALSLVLCVLLLFWQAISDLYLPNLMSDIVNTGIQQNGIERAAPNAMSGSAKELLSLLLGEDGKLTLDENYHEIYPLHSSVAASPASLVLSTEKALRIPDSDKITWINSAEGGVYALDTADQSTLDSLDRSMGVAAWTLINLMGEMSPESGDVPDTDEGTSSEGLQDIDMQQLYAMIPMLSQLPEDMIGAARTSAEAVDDMLLLQSGTMLTRALYLDLGADLSAIQSAYILRTGLLMLLVALAGGVATVSVALLSSRTAAGVARDLRHDVFAKVQAFSAAEIDRFSTASLITRTTNDVNQMQMLLVMGIRMVFYAPMMAVGGVIMAVSKSASMSWLIAAAVVFLLGMILVVFAVALPRFKLIQKLVDKLNLVSRENLTGLLVIRAFGTQDHEKARYDDVNKELTGVNLFIQRVMVLMMPIMMLVMNGMSVIIIWSGAHQIAESQLQIGDMMAFIQYAMQIMMSFMMISMMFIFIPRAAVSADRIKAVLDTDTSIKDPESPVSFDSARRGVVSFDNVSFRYPGAEEDVLHNISFTAQPGQTTAIIGSTGSGKSTLIHLLLRFYDITGGSLTINGAEVSRVRQHDLRKAIGYIPQKGMLMTGTIRSNLAYGCPDASDEDLERAASIAQAMEFISEKPARFDDPISQGGVNVSGGQKQRLSIARALAKKPDIFVFDDSFSALDYKTDLTLRRALKDQTEDVTVIIVAQRVATIRNAEQIIVLDNGSVAGIGTHSELLKSCPQYREIAASQLSEEEMAQ